MSGKKNILSEKQSLELLLYSYGLKFLNYFIFGLLVCVYIKLY